MIWYFPFLFIFCAFVSGTIATNNGRGGLAWFFLGLLFGPCAFSVALLPAIKEDRPEKEG